MSERRIARTVFYLAAIVIAAYGLLLLSMPELQFDLSRDPGAPQNAGWVRWSGGLLVGMAFAALLATANPDKQGSLVLGLAASYLLMSLSLLYSAVAGEYQGHYWGVSLQIGVSAALALAMFLLLTKQARMML
jgi:hypothetical protein